MRIEDVSPEVESLAWNYLERLHLPSDKVWLTAARPVFESWLGRRVSATLGGAYAYLPGHKVHAILINLPRIDLSQPRSVEIVVCEEFLHMRHWLDGDRRRHAKHGHDRIAVQVSELTGASMEGIRACLQPVQRRAFKYRYACPTCSRQVLRRRKGTWSCGSCSPRFSHRYVLVLQEELNNSGVMASSLEIEA